MFISLNVALVSIEQLSLTQNEGSSLKGLTPFQQQKYKKRQSKAKQENDKMLISSIYTQKYVLHYQQFTFRNSPWRLNSRPRHRLVLKMYRLNVKFTVKEMIFFASGHINVNTEVGRYVFSFPFGHKFDKASRPPFFPPI